MCGGGGGGGGGGRGGLKVLHKPQKLDPHKQPNKSRSV